MSKVVNLCARPAYSPEHVAKLRANVAKARAAKAVKREAAKREAEKAEPASK